MGTRKYTKRNTKYWDNLSKKLSKENPKTTQQLLAKVDNSQQLFEPSLIGEPYYSEASYTRTSIPASNRSVSRSTYNSRALKIDRYSNIDRFCLPYSYSGDYVNASDTILLCQKAYANVSIFRNTIDLMSEFANSDIFIDSGDNKSREFLGKWLKRIKFWKVKDQFFREYYRSGNVFFYAVKAQFSNQEMSRIKNHYSSSAINDKIVSRYILLNPADIAYGSALSHQSNNYKKILSKFELLQLESPKTEEAKLLLESLPEETKRKIKEGNYLDDGVYVDLDPNLVKPIFYKKQDYEPFAIPFGYPVLDDINWKLELKKIDQSISRTVENVLLLITMGAEPDKGGINYHHLSALQSIFSSEKAGRVLVSDYTTKGEFIIPDLNKVLGPEKYQIVNEDIRQGLQNVLFEEGKYSNNAIKTKIFIKRLKDARQEFLNFIQTEAEMTCADFGLRNCPEIKFVETDMSDDTSLQKMTTRLIELGILHPSDGIESIKTHQYPSREQMEESQKKLASEREKGWYNPLVGGVPMIEDVNNKTPTSIPPKSTGRPKQTDAKYKIEDVAKASKELSKFKVYAEKKSREHYGQKRLSSEQKEVIHKMCENIFQSSESKIWRQNFSKVLQNKLSLDDLEPLDEVKELSYELDLSGLEASLMYHSKKLENN